MRRSPPAAGLSYVSTENHHKRIATGTLVALFAAACIAPTALAQKIDVGLNPSFSGFSLEKAHPTVAAS